MRDRRLVHVAGPRGAGKTTFVEVLLARRHGFVTVARCVRNDTLPRLRESSPRNHPELRRYLRAGAYAAALITFPAHPSTQMDFFETNLLMEYSTAVLLEGDDPLGNVDLRVFVAPPPEAGETLYVRRQVDVAAAHRAKIDAWERLLSGPEGMATWMDEIVGIPLGDYVRGNPSRVEDVRASMLAGVAAARTAPPPTPVERWAVSERYQGIEHAGLVIVNVRDPAERAAAEQLVADQLRLRKDDVLFKDILGWRGQRTPITAVVADLTQPRDAGLVKAMARVRRTLRS